MEKKSIKKFQRLPDVEISWKALFSPAFRDLPHAAKGALLLFFGKANKTYTDPFRYDAEFTFTYAEARQYGFSSATFAKATRALDRYGFIDYVFISEQRVRNENIFRLSKRWELYDGSTGDIPEGVATIATLKY